MTATHIRGPAKKTEKDANGAPCWRALCGELVPYHVSPADPGHPETITCLECAQILARMLRP